MLDVPGTHKAEEQRKRSTLRQRLVTPTFAGGPASLKAVTTASVTLLRKMAVISEGHDLGMRESRLARSLSHRFCPLRHSRCISARASWKQSCKPEQFSGLQILSNSEQEQGNPCMVTADSMADKHNKNIAKRPDVSLVHSPCDRCN